MRTRALPFLLASSVAVALGCNTSGGPTDPDDCVVVNMVLYAPSTLAVGEEQDASYSALGNSACLSVPHDLAHWENSNPSIASMQLINNPDGPGQYVRLRGLQSGMTRVTVTLQALTRSQEITVSGTAPPPPPPPPLAFIDVVPATPSLPIGASVAMNAVCRDGTGAGMTCPTPPTWTIAPATGIVTLSAGGVVTGVAAGTVTITATIGSITGQTTITITAGTATVRLAYALADQPITAAYTPDPAYQLNGLGGNMTVARTGTGLYTVTIPGFGGTAGESRVPLVASVNSGAVTCVAVSWTLIGVTNGTVNVACTNAAGSAVDSRFSILVVGQGGLPGRFAFGYSGPTGGFPAPGATVDLDAASSWTSGTPPLRMMRDDIAQYRVYMNMRLPARPALSDVPIVTPAGSAGSRCNLNAWGSGQDGGPMVDCFPLPGTAGTISPFVGVFVDEGRAGWRFGSAWASMPNTAEYQAPETARRNSSGNGITLRNVGLGRYEVVFTGLGRLAPTGREVVFVSGSNLLGRVTCQVQEPWSTGVAGDLTIRVACHDAVGAPINRDFVVVLIE